MSFKITIETIIAHIGRNIFVHIIKILLGQIVQLKKIVQKITKIIPLCKSGSHVERRETFIKFSTVITSKLLFMALHLKLVAIETDRNGIGITVVYRKKYLSVEPLKFLFQYSVKNFGSHLKKNFKSFHPFEPQDRDFFFSPLDDELECGTFVINTFKKFYVWRPTI